MATDTQSDHEAKQVTQRPPLSGLLVCDICEAGFNPLYEGVTTTAGREICWNCSADIACGCKKLEPGERIDT